jgi:immune inhibitor A
MRKILLSICFTFFTLTLFASKADPTIATIKQSDGTTLRVCLHGDKDVSWYTTTDGVVLKQINGNYYIANIDEQGILSCSNQLAHELEVRNDIEKRLVKHQNRDLFISKVKEITQKNARKISIANANPPYFPHMGNPKVLVILAEFSDVSFADSNAREVFDSYLNTEGRGNTFAENAAKGDYTLTNGNYGSVSQYFNDMSFGAFKPLFDVYGPYKVNAKSNSYRKKREKSDDYINNASSLVKEVCDLAKDDIDFSLYDSNDDNIVDLIYIIYAGYGSNITGNDEELIWPHASETSTGYSYNGKKIDRYGVSQELNGYPGSYTTQPDKQINGIGVFCHEFSHAMGLPDMYPKNANVWDNQEMEAWDLMDCGCYFSARCPSAYTAWEREAMGWMSVDTLFVDEKNIEFDPIDFGGKAYRFMNPNDKNKREYFMLENIQDRRWNQRRQAHGLLVYHVNYASDVVGLSDYPNNVEGKPRMAVVPADGWVMSSYKVGDDKYKNPVTGKAYTTTDFINNIAGDPFPGTQNVTELKYEMNLPNYSWQIGDPEVKQAIVNIRENTETGTITFDYVTDITNAIDRTIVDVKTVDNTIYSLDGRKVSHDINQLNKGIYIRNNKKFIVK